MATVDKLDTEMDGWQPDVLPVHASNGQGSCLPTRTWEKLGVDCVLVRGPEFGWPSCPSLDHHNSSPANEFHPWPAK